MQNNSNVNLMSRLQADNRSSKAIMDKEYADECIVGVTIKNWSHFFADRATKCVEYGLLDDALRFVDLALTEKYLEVLKQVTTKVEKKRDRLLNNAKFDAKKLDENCFKSKL